jgi:signal transduction histidine kinase
MHVLPLGIGGAVWLMWRNGKRLLAFTAGLILLSLGFFFVFRSLPLYTQPVLFITRPALIMVPLFWAGVGLACWRRHATGRLLPTLGLLAITLFIANVFMLYSRSPHDPPAIVAHVGVVAGCLVLLLSVMQMASTDMRERIRAEQALKEKNTELRDANRQLEAANKELEAFTYSVSHDLRAPLRHVIGFAEMLQRNGTSNLDETGRRYLTTIVESSRRMGELIDHLLAFSRLGRAEMQMRAVDLDHVVKDTLAEFQADATHRNIQWRIDRLGQVLGDASLLGLVFSNLISNALKFTRNCPSPLIEIGCRRNHEELVVFVRDNGAGFDMKYADKLFGVFQRLHSSDEFDGTGIGLANVRRIISRHGGRSWAEGAPDRGATLYFSLPLHQKG